MQYGKTYSRKQEPVRRNYNSRERWDSSTETCIGNMRQKDNTHGGSIKTMRCEISDLIKERLYEDSNVNQYRNMHVLRDLCVHNGHSEQNTKKRD